MSDWQRGSSRQGKGGHLPWSAAVLVAGRLHGDLRESGADLERQPLRQLQRRNRTGRAAPPRTGADHRLDGRQGEDAEGRRPAVAEQHHARPQPQRPPRNARPAAVQEGRADRRLAQAGPRSSAATRWSAPGPTGRGAPSPNNRARRPTGASPPSTGSNTGTRRSSPTSTAKTRPRTRTSSSSTSATPRASTAPSCTAFLHQG